MQPLQDPITVRPLRLTEDVKTPEPGRERESGQQQYRDRPRKIINSSPDRLTIRLVITIKTVVHLGRPRMSLRFQCPSRAGDSFATSNEVPHPQVRLAFGFRI